METNGHRTDGEGNPEPERNYAAHQADPGPSPEAINEKSDRPASNMIWVAIIVAIIIMVLVYFIFTR